MNIETIQQDIPKLFGKIISLDIVEQQQTIDLIYDDNADFCNPYMTLSSKEEIQASYKAFTHNNMEIFLLVESTTFDKENLKVMAEIQQAVRPKALGGLMSIKYI